MPNYSYRCPECQKIEDHILPYEESIKEGIVQCEQCKQAMIKYFGKPPLMVFPEGNCGNAANSYTSKKK